MDFVMDVYRTSKSFPRDELYGLASQLRKAAAGVPTNIAEGKRVSRPTNSTTSEPGRGKDPLDKAAELGKVLNGLIGAIRPAA